MKRFHFPLDRVRRWRAEQAEIEELKLRQLSHQLAALGAQKQRVESDLFRSERQVLGQVFIEASEVQSLQAYRRHALNQIREMEARERQYEAGIREQRKKLIETRQKAELLTRLKQKALDEWNEANEHEQETLAAELYLAKRARL